jgi:predicted ester cyclase
VDIEAMKEGHRLIVEDLPRAAATWIHTDYVHHDPLIPETHAVRSREAYVAAHGAFDEAVPDQVTTAEEVIADGAFSSARWRFSGTHTGDFRGIAPTGNRIEFWGMTMYRWEGGQVVEGWTLFDVMGFNQQMGLS